MSSNVSVVSKVSSVLVVELTSPALLSSRLARSAAKNARHLRGGNESRRPDIHALQAVAGLFCLVLYLYQPALYANELKPWSRLFTLTKEPGYLMLEQNYELPDFT
jgi:hypothetical protein